MNRLFKFFVLTIVSCFGLFLVPSFSSKAYITAPIYSGVYDQMGIITTSATRTVIMRPIASYSLSESGTINIGGSTYTYTNPSYNGSITHGSAIDTLFLTPVNLSTTGNLSGSFTVNITSNNVYVCEYEFSPTLAFSNFSSDFIVGDEYYMIYDFFLNFSDAIVTMDTVEGFSLFRVSPSSSFFVRLSKDLTAFDDLFIGFPTIHFYTISSVPEPTFTYDISLPTPDNAQAAYFARWIPTNTNQILRQIAAQDYQAPSGFNAENQTISQNIDSINEFETTQFQNLDTSFSQTGIESMTMSELVGGFALVSQVNNYIFNNSGAEFQTFIYGLLAIGVIVVVLSVIGRVGRGFKGG